MGKAIVFFKETSCNAPSDVDCRHAGDSLAMARRINQLRIAQGRGKTQRIVYALIADASSGDGCSYAEHSLARSSGVAQRAASAYGTVQLR